MASATRSDLSEAKILEYEDAGRGNQDSNVIVAVPGVAAKFIYNVFSGSDTLAYFATTPTLIAVPIVEDDTFIVGIRSGTDAITADLVIDLPTSATTGDLVRAAIVSQLNASNNFVDVTSVAGSSVVQISMSAGGITSGIPSITSQASEGTGTANDIISFVNGLDSTTFDETVFKFTGPFTNINPNKDALQGLSIVARAIDSFLNSYSDPGVSEIGIGSLLTVFKTRLDTAFPAASELPGISPTVPNQLSKITLKGSRRPSSGLLGRDGKTIDDIFVNDAADFGLRQLTLRIYDSFMDTLDFIEGSASFTDSQKEARKLLREFDVDFGELERSLGRNRSGDIRSEIPYENTIVNGSGDQGMLIYADQIADIIASLSGTSPGNYTLFRAAVALQSKERLLLKN